MNIFKARIYFYSILLLAALISCKGNAQKISNDRLAEQLRQHVYYLADDKLNGRFTGSKGEKQAAEYIAKEFKEAGLKPAGDGNSYFQHFNVNTGYRLGKDNLLKINGTNYQLNEDFYPVAITANGKARGQIFDAGFGINAPDKNHNDYHHTHDAEGKIFLISLSLPDGNHPHSKFLDYKNWRDRLTEAMKYKPAAVIFYDSEEQLDVKAFKMFSHLHRSDIPVIHVTPEVAEQLKQKTNAKVHLATELEEKRVNGMNVAGFADRGKEHTVIIGAHYDHLGTGEHGHTLYTGGPAVHNGADDNASGTAALIELARLINMSKADDYNYLFIAFSGEELGLLGSNFFTASKTFSADKTNLMLNMDMVGRLDADTRELGINGTGTAPVWDSLITNLHKEVFIIKTTESGMGNSDHTSFYLSGVPAIHFFTGVHSDYHKPSDDADKLNYAGMADVVMYIYDLALALDDQPKLVFQKTKEAEQKVAPRFKVTLGIIPDYFYDGEGIKIDGVSSGKTAEKAGMKSGDIIMRLDKFNTKDMYAYMEALSKIEKGTKTQAVILRDGKELTLDVEF